LSYGCDDARPANDHDRTGGVRPAYYDGHPATDTAARQADAVDPVRAVDTPGHSATCLQRPERGAEAEVRGGQRARPVVRHPGPSTVPLQRLSSARRGRVR